MQRIVTFLAIFKCTYCVSLADRGLIDLNMTALVNSTNQVANLKTVRV